MKTRRLAAVVTVIAHETVGDGERAFEVEVPRVVCDRPEYLRVIAEVLRKMAHDCEQAASPILLPPAMD